VIIDGHGHWMSSGLREWGWQLLSHRNASDNALPLKGIDEENARNLACMDARGIDVQIVSIRPVGMLSHENAFIQVPWARAFNNTLAEALKREPRRLRGLAHLPLSDAPHAVEELERAVTELGLIGAIVNPNPPGDDSALPLDDEWWYPLYARAQELDVPLFIHAASLRTRRYQRDRSAYMLGQTVEETIAGPTLVYGGVLETFPRLKLILAHGGGATTFQIGRYLTPPGREERSL
jgi:predicted TIM-barrel fold metal-dependent hydrolase